MSTVGYDNTISIAGGLDSNGNNYNSELLVAKGGLITRGYDLTVFANYSTYIGNSINYSTIASDTNRFATFAWNLVKPSPGNSYTRINLKITFDPSTIFTTLNGGYQVNSSTFILLYRIEDLSLNAPTSAVAAINVSSIWINGNGNTVGVSGISAVNNSNYSTGPRFGLAPSGVTNAGGIATYKLMIPSISSSSRNQRLYIRIGAQNNASFKITNIEANIGLN